MYIAIILLVIRTATDRTLTVPLVLTATCLVLLFCDTQYIPPYQIGYIWMVVLVLAFLHLYFNFAKNTSTSLLVCTGLFFLSIITGNAHEAINIGVGGAIINMRSLTSGTSLQPNMVHDRRIRYWWLVPVSFSGNSRACGNNADISFFLPLKFLSHFKGYILLIILVYKLVRRLITLQCFYHDNSFFINAMLIPIAFIF